MLFSQQVKAPESRLVGPAGSEAPAAEKPASSENAAPQAAPAETAAAQPAAAPAEAAQAAAPQPEPSAPAAGATATLSDAPAAGGSPLSEEERAALNAELKDADPQVKDLANRLASLEKPAAEGGSGTPAEATPPADQAKAEGVDIRQAVAEAEGDAAPQVQQASATEPAETAAAEPAAAEVAAMKSAPADAGDENPLAKMSDAEILNHLIGRYEKRSVADPDGEVATSDLIALRTLMVLAGNPDGAVAPVEGWKSAEQEFLSYQMLALWQLVDPQAHPVRARRWTTALPDLRKATSFLAASTDTLEVRSLAWCTEVILYDQIKPFPSDRFAAGQQVILYSEIDNFGVERLSDGVETHMQGTYEILDAATGKNVATLVGEVDRQKHNKAPRDYFLAYVFYLPNDLEAGKYKLQLTVEDFKSGKYGRSSIPFEITAR